MQKFPTHKDAHKVAQAVHKAAHLHQKTFNLDDYCFVLFNRLYTSRRKRHTVAAVHHLS